MPSDCSDSCISFASYSRGMYRCFLVVQYQISPFFSVSLACCLQCCVFSLAALTFHIRNFLKLSHCPSCISGGGPTLALGDFSRAVDLRAFPKDVAFTGTSYTSSFECEQMKRNEPWKYQVVLESWYPLLGTVLCVSVRICADSFTEYIHLHT